MKSIDEIYRDFPDEARERQNSGSSPEPQLPQAAKTKFHWYSIPVALFLKKGVVKTVQP